MKILTLADFESKLLWDNLDKDYLKSADLILSCGDLKHEYLDFIATFTSAPVLFVRGNHDRTHGKPDPSGCICIEDSIYDFEGVRILGLGGSIRYKPGPDQYTEAEMAKRIRKLRFKLHRSKGFDILLTHSPIRGVNDAEDPPHHGFECFKSLLEKYEPKYMIHGHVHMNYGANMDRFSSYANTQCINAYEKYMLEI